MTSAYHPMPGVPRDTTRRIGLLGGSFNPAHEGHRHVSLEALKRLGLDEVWWLVSPQNPLKAGDGMEPLATRLARARQIGRHPRIRVETPELALGTRYTLDTVRALRRAYPKARFVWLMGADILPQLGDWQGWRELFAAIPIAAFARPGWSYPALVSAAPRAFARYRIEAEAARMLASCEPPAWCFIPGRLDSHSATAIRAVRPPRVKAKGKTISDQSSPERGRQLPDRSQDTDALLALVNGKFVTLRVPYPTSFYAKGMDGRIDDPNGGWKGRGIWTTAGNRTPFHVEGGKGNLPKVVHFQMRPAPLAD